MATKTQTPGSSKVNYGSVDPKTGKSKVLGTTTYGEIDPKTGQQRQTYTPAPKTTVTYGEQQKAGQDAAGAQSERTRAGVFQNKTSGKYYDARGNEVSYNGQSVAPVASVKTTTPSAPNLNGGYSAEGIRKDQIASNPAPQGQQWVLQPDGKYRLGQIPGYSQQSTGSPLQTSQALNQTTSQANRPSQVPTSSQPVVTIGQVPNQYGNNGSTSDGRNFEELTDREKLIEINYRIARDKAEFNQFSDQELKFLIGQQVPDTTAAGDDGGTVAADIIAERETQLGQKELTLEERRAQLVREEEQRLNAEFERSKGLLTQGAERQKDASQTRFSFSGFGRSTANDEQLGLIEQSLSEQIMIAEKQRSAALALFRAQQEDADEGTLQGYRDQIDTLRLEEDKAKIERASKIAELNATNKVTGLEAINNLITGLGLEAAESSTFDKGLTELINDGHLYKVDASGVPMRVTDSNGNPIKTGVNASGDQDLQYVPPLQDAFTGKPITPGYAFDKNTGQLTEILPNGQRNPLPGGQQAMENYKNFSDYTSRVGNGKVVTGSPYHQGLEVDIDGTSGDLIPSFTSGKVVKVENSDKGYGNSVLVEDANGNIIRYAHLQAASVALGQSIVAGQPLGTMGRTGNVIGGGGPDSGSHLHIEARDKSGKLISPDGIDPASTWQSPVYETDMTDLWRAEAAMKGYVAKDEVAAYLNAKGQGVNLPDKATAAKTQDNFDNLTTLITKYKPLNDEVSTLQQGFSYLQGFDINHKNPSTDQALVFSFMKVLDPTSVVREAEYATTINSFSVFDKLDAAVKKQILNQGLLTTSQRKSITDEMKRLYKNKAALYQKQIDQATKVGNEYGLDPTLYITFFEDIKTYGSATGGSTSSSDPLGIKNKL